MSGKAPKSKNSAAKKSGAPSAPVAPVEEEDLEDVGPPAQKKRKVDEDESDESHDDQSGLVRLLEDLLKEQRAANLASQQTLLAAQQTLLASLKDSNKQILDQVSILTQKMVDREEHVATKGKKRIEEDLAEKKESTASQLIVRLLFSIIE